MLRKSYSHWTTSVSCFTNAVCFSFVILFISSDKPHSRASLLLVLVSFLTCTHFAVDLLVTREDVYRTLPGLAYAHSCTTLYNFLSIPFSHPLQLSDCPPLSLSLCLSIASTQAQLDCYNNYIKYNNTYKK